MTAPILCAKCRYAVPRVAAMTCEVWLCPARKAFQALEAEEEQRERAKAKEGE